MSEIRIFTCHSFNEFHLGFQVGARGTNRIQRAVRRVIGTSGTSSFAAHLMDGVFVRPEP